MRLTIQTLIAIATLTLAASIFAADSIKIAHIDPMSGPFGLAGQTLGKHFDAIVEDINSKGTLGKTPFEIFHFDNKASALDSVTLLQQIIDSGIRFVIQGGGSNVAHALSDTLAKHNSRNPDKAVLYLNFAAQDPALTNDRRPPRAEARSPRPASKVGSTGLPSSIPSTRRYRTLAQ